MIFQEETPRPRRFRHTEIILLPILLHLFTDQSMFGIGRLVLLSALFLFRCRGATTMLLLQLVDGLEGGAS